MKTRQAYYILDPETDTKQAGDEYWKDGEWHQSTPGSFGGSIYRRPIPDAPTPDDGWIPWGGGECPVAHDSWVDVKMRGGGESSNTAGFWWWPHIDPSYPSDIIAYRVVKAPGPQWLPLGPDDVPPGSYLRPRTEYVGWIVISEIDAAGVHLHGGRTLTYPELLEHKWEILRPGEDWQPCKKLAK